MIHRIVVYFRLGRVSNLPTVWTNAMAGAALTTGELPAFLLIGLAAALSLFYAGGMFLNDAFDAAFDRVHRPERPIPAGWIRRREVLAAGLVLLAAGELLLALVLWRVSAPLLQPLVFGLILAGLILYYNYHHKENPLGPLVMALCRALIYLIAGAALAAPLNPALLSGALLLTLYVLGLTCVARHETGSSVVGWWPYLALSASPLYFALGLRGDPFAILFVPAFAFWIVYSLLFLWRKPADVGRTVVQLIAGICLLDAIFVLDATGEPLAALLPVAAFGLTLSGQRFIAGT